MKKIESFQVDHTILDPGIYVSRVDKDITTYDLRTRKPNTGELIDNGTIHSLEHMFATMIRNSEITEDVIYFGPMGCQTGFYLLVRNAKNEKVLEVIKKSLQDIINHKGEMFGASKIECGNYINLDLNLAKKEARIYLDILNQKEHTFIYK
ncbi:MAG TPA: S-ribosylhomocysteine lyase [Lachnospiraceae bacterium]|nr:S-ribosylhomocysteine lyase [Lachnospiraceae bacterium]